MKKNYNIPILMTAIFLLILMIISGCKKSITGKESFGVAFLTDIHISFERNAVQGLSQALDSVNKLNPDFIITGGDLIMDALGQSYNRADSLYDLYSEVIIKAKSPVYNTMGNHEIYGIYSSESGADPLNPEYGEKMFETRLGKSYYSFDHKGWKFIVLNSIEDTGKESYIGQIDSLQIEWIKNELKKTDSKTTIVLSTHIPFLTAETQRYQGSTAASDSATVVSNSKDILDLFNDYNLKLVLQGHLHIFEQIYINGVHFLTGGAVSAGWWKGPNRETQEGFVYLTFYKDKFSWRYVDYGWEPEL